MNASKQTEIKSLLSKPMGGNPDPEVAFGNHFFSAFSAQLTNPLSTIQSNIQILKKYSDSAVSDFTKETFALTESSIENILGFVENLDFLSEASGSRLGTKHKRISVRATVKQALDEIKFKNLDCSRIKVKITSDNTEIFSDKNLLSRILFNLLSNALKFSKHKVELFVSISVNELNIKVCDTGIGIPKDQLKTILNPFVRGTNAKMISGTGLGLAIVARALECLKGSLSVNSEIGEGTEIKVCIPSGISRVSCLPTKSEILYTK